MMPEIPRKLYDKGVKIRETAVETLGPTQERLDLADPMTTDSISTDTSGWVGKTEIYEVPSGKRYIMKYIIVSCIAGSYLQDFIVYRRPTSGSDEIVGRSIFNTARSITYPAGEEFKAGEKLLLNFQNNFPSGYTITFHYFIHGILEEMTEA